MKTKRKVRIVYSFHASSVDDNSMSPPINETTLYRSELGALRAAVEYMAQWADGEWQEYNANSVKRLRSAIEDGYYATAIEIWNDMSVVQLTVERERVHRIDRNPIEMNWPDPE